MLAGYKMWVYAVLPSHSEVSNNDALTRPCVQTLTWVRCRQCSDLCIMPTEEQLWQYAGPRPRPCLFLATPTAGTDAPAACRAPLHDFVIFK